MQHRRHGPALGGQLPAKGQQPELMKWVQKRGGLVQKQHPGVLGQDLTGYTIQGYRDGVFWDRNTSHEQLTAGKNAGSGEPPEA